LACSLIMLERFADHERNSNSSTTGAMLSFLEGRPIVAKYGSLE
jgi:hypothetical protein